MHMADALVSPAVGGTMWATAAGLIAYSSRQLRFDSDDQRIPLMGVTAAFVFAAQMINFTIPATGSSGHLGGGLLLAIVLGPHAAFLAITSVLAVQALLFADGGLLSLGCNVVNLGLFPCFIAYPLIYRPIVGKTLSTGRLVTGSIAAAIVTLQLGAFGVVLETLASGVTALPLDKFLLLMQPIHLAIGVVEGVATSAVVFFIWRARPEILHAAQPSQSFGLSLVRLVAVMGVVTALVGGAVSWFASTNPDGLEWSVAKAAGSEELPAPKHAAHSLVAAFQARIAVLPDYGFKQSEAEQKKAAASAWPTVDAGTTVSGLVGSVLTLCIAGLAILALRRRREST